MVNPPPTEPADPTAAIIARVRSMVGDFAAPFRDVFTGGDEISSYDLSETNLGSVTASIVDIPTGVSTVIQEYSLDYREGRIILAAPYAPLPHGKMLVVEGTGAGMFSDQDMQDFFTDAFTQHTNGRTIEQRYRDGDPSIGPQPGGYGMNYYGCDTYGDTLPNDGTGFIRYRYVPITMETIDPVELYPLSLLMAQMVLWTMLLDASTDIDISTAEGTFVPRTQRFRQLMEMQDALQKRYQDICAQLNIGLYRVEVFYLRRISRTTNRLVPLFKPREYDDTGYPQRILPPVDARDADQSGLPSAWIGGVWG
jgi:hypothetical protein